MYKVTKIIEFCYGHRLLNHKGKCRYLHGHNALLEVDIETDVLDKEGMVMDFTDIREKVKHWVDENLDHKMLLSKKDPAIEMLDGMKEPHYVMEENPTAENIAKVIFQAMVAMGVTPAEIRLWETPTSCATYRSKR